MSWAVHPTVARCRVNPVAVGACLNYTLIYSSTCSGRRVFKTARRAIIWVTFALNSSSIALTERALHVPQYEVPVPARRIREH